MHAINDLCCVAAKDTAYLFNLENYEAVLRIASSDLPDRPPATSNSLLFESSFLVSRRGIYRSCTNDRVPE